MTEVRKHRRQTASGKTTTVRKHTRNTGSAGQDESIRDTRNAYDPERRAPSVGSAALSQPAPRPPRESWWDEDGAPAEGDWWADDEPQEPQRLGDREFPVMQQQMREWRARVIDRPAVVPDTSPLGRSLGTDTYEGAASFARLSAYRDAGYDGPLDSEGRIPDPDDPAEHESLHALAAMKEARG